MNKQTNKDKGKKEAIVKFANDFLPLAVFLVVFNVSEHENPIIPATFWMILVTIITISVSYILVGKIAKMPLFSAGLLGIFGALTVLSGDDIFIKIKPTLLNLLFSIILFYGYFAKKPLMSYLFGSKIQLPTKAWLTVSLRYAIFFLGLALLNEIIWRNFSTEFWVNFKVFGILPISILFSLTQISFIVKNAKK